jgi:putative ABC transport system permease protein
MSFWNSFVEGMNSLLANKLRSFLTILGIVIGVASVIAMLGIGNGTQASIEESLASMGTNQFTIRQGGDASVPEALTLEDAYAIQDANLDSVAAVSPTIQGNTTLTIIGNSYDTSVYGITPDYMVAESQTLIEGQEISQTNVDNADTVIILGYDVAEELFDRTTDLVGEKVRINGQSYTVLGVLESKGESSFGSMDDMVLLPITTAQQRVVRRNQSGSVSSITIQCTSAEAVDIAIEEVSQILRVRHLSTLGVDDFDIVNTASMMEAASSITGIVTGFLGGVAGISLVVGGIGIMNIMLVSVIERTKEIGLRKALGARKRTILSQFLVESILLSVIGGLLGILFGWGISALVGTLLDIPPKISISSIILATAFSAFVGIMFGLYPANRAANLQPVEALRTD